MSTNVVLGGILIKCLFILYVEIGNISTVSLATGLVSSSLKTIEGFFSSNQLEGDCNSPPTT